MADYASLGMLGISLIGVYIMGNIQGMWIGYRLQFNENMGDSKQKDAEGDKGE